MPFFQRLSYHLPLLRYQLGHSLQIGKNQYKIRGYFANRLGMQTVHHEEAINELIADALDERPGAFIDIGANIGQTMLKVLGVDPDRTYFGFEPQHACCHLIGTFLKDNHIKDFHILPLALSDDDRLAKFYSNGAFDEMGSLIGDVQGRAYSTINYVQMRAGDAVLQELGCTDPAIIKIDVEGAELSVLKGLQKTLKNAQPILFFEVMPNFTGDDRAFLSEDACMHQRQVAQEIWDILSQHGYRVFCVDDDGNQIQVNHFELDDPEAFTSFNYVARPA